MIDTNFVYERAFELNHKNISCQLISSLTRNDSYISKIKFTVAKIVFQYIRDYFFCSIAFLMGHWMDLADNNFLSRFDFNICLIEIN